jgi:hypothetical protein
MDRGQCLQHEPAKQHGASPDPRIAQQPIQREQTERQELDVQCLKVRNAGECVRVEREGGAGHESRRPTAGPSPQHQTHRPAGQREAGNHHQVVGQDR